ncbi:MAG: site-specific recombinase [Betaproteobacteria bacterium]
MEKLLSRFADPDTDPTDLFTQLIDQIRPANPTDSDTARRNLQALCFILGSRADLRAEVRGRLIALQQEFRHSQLYTLTGILPNTGFFSEIFRRIGHKFLPDILDPDLLRTFLRKVFHRPTDRHWVTGVGEETWLQLIEALHFEESLPDHGDPVVPNAVSEILRSLRVISYWIAASGMEPELLRLEPSLESHESPFVTQNIELIAYIDAYFTGWRKTETPGNDDKHLRVLFAQCREVIERVHKRAARSGTSIRLTYDLQRLQQLLRRGEHLLDIVENLRLDPDGQSAYPAIVSLFACLVHDECERDNLRQHWRQNTELIALRVTENASAHGEHYITETRSEYGEMARSAMIGGCIIAFMACFKLLLGKAEMPPLTGALAYCLNYALGFCLIHIVHGSVATKQPAMTANAIASSIDAAGGKLRNMDNLTHLIARTIRTQLIAILGNIVTAVPLAGLLVYAIFTLTGEHFASPEKASHLLEDQNIAHSGALIYAAIAGVCLFLAGLISGYFDNYAAYNRIPERILQLEWPKRLIGDYRLRRVSAYIGDNLGALAGNFVFGFLLGGTAIFGVLFGLPIDIRHVTFSSAFVGIAFVSFDFSMSLMTLLRAALDVAAIGLVNLTVSFALALNVALRSRKVAQTPWRMLAGATLRHLLQHPRDFFLPPKKQKAIKE